MGSVGWWLAAPATPRSAPESATGSAAVQVRQRVVALALVPAELALRLGDNRTMTHTASDRRGNAIAGRALQGWSSSDPRVASVDANGTIAALADGSTTISASADGVTAQARVTVRVSPPVVSTGSASADTASATLHASVDPQGLATEAWFEYGTTFALGSRTASGALSAGEGARAFSAVIAGLRPATQYHYRVGAANAAGTVTGETRVFQTTRPALSAPTLSVSVADSVATLAWSIPRTTDAVSNGIERRIGTAGSWEEIAVVSGSSFANVPGGGGFAYRVRACAGGECSAYSNTVTVSFPPQRPRVETRAVTGITSNTAVFHGFLAPNGAPTTWWFEYDEYPSFFEPEICYPGDEVPLDIQSGWTVDCQPDFGLAGSTEHHVRLVGENSYGRSYGSIVTFTTSPSQPPVVTTDSVNLIGSYGAWAWATASGRGLPARLWFEVTDSTEFAGGDFPNFYATADTISIPLWDRQPSVYMYIDSLSASTTYRVRAVVRNSLGTVQGNEVPFTTMMPSAGAGSPVVVARAPSLASSATAGHTATAKRATGTGSRPKRR
jgi:hypothetical protein